MQTITTVADLERFLSSNEQAIASGELFFRWSDGPDADKAQGWVSSDWSDPAGPVELDGLSAVAIGTTHVSSVQILMRSWKDQVWGENGYFLLGRELTRCIDDEPLVGWVDPIATIDETITRRESINA